MTELIKYLRINNIEYELGVDTRNLVSFKVGGIADIVIYPSEIRQIKGVIKVLKHQNIKYTVLGCGTNCYFSDIGYKGAIISTVYLNKISYIESDILCAECGALIKDCAEFAYKRSLTGLEFTYGIPGSVGGCVYMNASAFNRQISFIIYKTEALDVSEGKIIQLKEYEHKYGNKTSIFSENKNLIILKAYFKLKKGFKNSIRIEMGDNFKKRSFTQPLDYPSAGSVFKRPMVGYASKYIDEAGLKGLSVGDAQVSTKHAGFIVNTNNAMAKDVNDLILIIKNKVKEKYGIILEEEIIFIE